MKKIILEFGDAADPGQVQSIIAEALDFPEYYGRNLDALYDCLTDLTEDHYIVLLRPAARIPVSDYLGRVRRVFFDASEENPHLSVSFQKSWK